MISETLRHTLLHWISRIVYFQLGVIVVISVVTFFLLAYRRWKTVSMKRFDEEYGEQIVDELLKNMEGVPQTILRRPYFGSSFKFESLQNSLLNQVQSVSGLEKDYLVRRYYELGFVSSDLVRYQSVFWWRRLGAVTRLKALSSPKLASFFQYALKDSNELVRATSMAALSELDHPLNAIQLGNLRLLLHFGRQSHMFEIASNWCRIHGFEKVFNLAVNFPRREIRDEVLRTIINMRTPEAGTYFAELLKNGENESPDLLADILMGLKEIGDPDNLEAVLPYIHHSDMKVQRRALEFALDFLPEERRSELRDLETNSTRGLQRIFEDWRSRKGAA